MTTNALTPIADYPIMEANADEIREAISEVATDGLSRFDLPTLKVPSGGGVSWEVPTPNGDTEPAKAVEGVILAVQDQRTYWSRPFGAGEAGPPDCYSLDLKTGYGDPGGDCATCPFAQYGTAEQGGGQACRQTKILYLLTQWSPFPYLLVVPPSSLKTVKGAMVKLAMGGKRPSTYVASFTLTKQKSAGGVEFAQIQMRHVEDLTPEHRAQIEPMVTMAKGLTGQVVEGVADAV